MATKSDMYVTYWCTIRFGEKYGLKHWKSSKTAAEMNQKGKFFPWNMHGQRAVDSMFTLAPKYHSHLMSAQFYEFCPHLSQLNNIDSSPFQIITK